MRATITRLGDTSMTTEIVLVRGGETAAEGELRHVFIEAGGGEAAADPGADPLGPGSLLDAGAI